MKRAALVKFILSTLLLLSNSLPAADFVVLQDPRQITLLNQYQQTLNERQKQQLGQFVPLQILKETTLDDQITPAWEVRFFKNIYYLLPQALSGTPHALFHHARLLRDTVRTLRTVPLRMGLRFNEGQKIKLAPGTLLMRFFRSGQYVYAAVINDQKKIYGWITANSSYWKIYHAPLTTPTPPQHLLNAIYEKIDRVNRKYESLTRMLNRQSGKNLPTPYWHVARKKGKIILILKPRKQALYFTRSTQQLIKELKNLLLGTKYQLFYSTGEIKIQ